MSTSGRDWEAIQRALSEATEGWSKAELIGLLGDLIREYVVERGLPTGSPSVASAPDFTQMDFPQLIIWLKNHVNLPELGRFSVEGQRVILDLDGPREFPTSHAERASRPAPPPPITPPSAAGRNPPPSAAGRNP
ncbi:hypothetical protein KKB55_22245, partial [Myxococcota bacterium]|nr:hypothetical protein [Myxococcota bacterium]